MRQRMMTVNRKGRAIKVCVEPTHPRGKFFLSCHVKRILTEEDQYRLCNVLDIHHTNALKRTPDDPLSVAIGEDTYYLSRAKNPQTPDRVWVDLVRLNN